MFRFILTEHPHKRSNYKLFYSGAFNGRKHIYLLRIENEIVLIRDSIFNAFTGILNKMN